MITRKLLLSVLTLLAVILTSGCKDSEADYVSLNIDNKEIAQGEEYQFFLTVQSLKGSEYSGSVRWTIDTDEETKSKKGADYQVASINNFGKVIGLKDGSAVVKAILSDGRYARAKLSVGRRDVTGDSLRVSRSNIYMKRNTTDTLTLSIKEKYADVQKYPIQLSLSFADDVDVPSGMLPKTECKLIPQEKVGTYTVELTSKEVGEKLVLGIEVGKFKKEVAVNVDFSLYLSFNTIDKDKPGDNPGFEKPMDFNLKQTQTLNINFYVDDEANRAQSEEAVKKALATSTNYSVSGNISMITGVPRFAKVPKDPAHPDDFIPGMWTMSIDLTVSDIPGSGSLLISVLGKYVRANINVDDGKAYKAIYISFAGVNSYVIPPQGLELTTTKIVEVSKVGQTPNTFKLPVHFYIDPDTRAPYIDWKVSQSGDPVIIPIGMQNINTKSTEFEFKIGTSTGTAKVTFKVYNPQGEKGGKFAPFLNQEITATINVQNSDNIIVESVTFDPKTSETDAKAVPLKAEIMPLAALAAWQAEYTIQELLNGAEATVDLKTGEVAVKHAGIIKVKATAGGVGKEKSDTHVITAKFKLDINSAKPVEISDAPNTMYMGESYTIKKLLKSNYVLNENEYQWKSSAPSIVSVDATGKIRALKQGDAKITVTVKDDYGMYAADQKNITVKMVNSKVDFSDPKFAQFFVIYWDQTTFYIDTEAGSPDFYTFELNTALSQPGVYNAGSDFTGTILFPTGEKYGLDSGTITINGGVMTFNLSISSGAISGSVIGARPIK
ncbi:MAG: Ig-like domain-containing protein [Bacteroidales bacterium]